MRLISVSSPRRLTRRPSVLVACSPNVSSTSSRVAGMVSWVTPPSTSRLMSACSKLLQRNSASPAAVLLHEASRSELAESSSSNVCWFEGPWL